MAVKLSPLVNVLVLAIDHVLLKPVFGLIFFLKQCVISQICAFDRGREYIFLTHLFGVGWTSKLTTTKFSLKRLEKSLYRQVQNAFRYTEPFWACITSVTDGQTDSKREPQLATALKVFKNDCNVSAFVRHDVGLHEWTATCRLIVPLRVWASGQKWRRIRHAAAAAQLRIRGDDSNNKVGDRTLPTGRRGFLHQRGPCRRRRCGRQRRLRAGRYWRCASNERMRFKRCRSAAAAVRGRMCASAAEAAT